MNTPVIHIGRDESTKTSLSIEADDLLNHTCLIGGGLGQAKAVWLNEKIIKSALTNGHGMLLVESESSTLRQTVIQTLDEANRATDFIEINAIDTSFVGKFITAIKNKRVIYICLADKGESFQSYFLSAIEATINQMWSQRGSVESKLPFIFAIMDTTKHLHKCWPKIITLGRSIKVAGYFQFNSFEEIERMKDKFATRPLIMNLLEKIGNRIIFKQSDETENERARALAGLYMVEVKSGIFGFGARYLENPIELLSANEVAFSKGIEANIVRL